MTLLNRLGNPSSASLNHIPICSVLSKSSPHFISSPATHCAFLALSGFFRFLVAFSKMRRLNCKEKIPENEQHVYTQKHTMFTIATMVVVPLEVLRHLARGNNKNSSAAPYSAIQNVNGSPPLGIDGWMALSSSESVACCSPAPSPTREVRLGLSATASLVRVRRGEAS